VNAQHHDAGDLLGTSFVLMYHLIYSRSLSSPLLYSGQCVTSLTQSRLKQIYFNTKYYKHRETNCACKQSSRITSKFGVMRRLEGTVSYKSLSKEQNYEDIFIWMFHVNEPALLLLFVCSHYAVRFKLSTQF
jgi:hypothetical protein